MKKFKNADGVIVVFDEATGMYYDSVCDCYYKRDKVENDEQWVTVSEYPIGTIVKSDRTSITWRKITSDSWIRIIEESNDVIEPFIGVDRTVVGHHGFVLPEKWCVEINHISELTEYARKRGIDLNDGFFHHKHNYPHYLYSEPYWSEPSYVSVFNPKEGSCEEFIEITLEQFKKYVI